MTMPTGKAFFLDFKYGSGSNDGENLADLGKFDPYYAGGNLKNYPIGTGDGTETVFTVDVEGLVTDSEVVYVDGVAQTAGYTMDYSAPSVTFDSAVTDGAAVTLDGTVTPGEGEDAVREIDFDITSEDISAESKKLKSELTIESQQDLLAYHGLNAEEELLAVMGDEIRREIDRILIHDALDKAAAGNVNWAKEMPADFDGSHKEYQATIYEAIIDANTLIYKKRYRNANWIVADPDTCSILEKVDGFKEVREDWSGGAGMGVEKFGIIKNRFTVYKDPMMKADTMLMGYKGQRFFETGYIYAPYIPLYVTPVVTDPDTFKSKRGVMSRYAKKSIIPEFYATVSLN